MNLEQSGGDNSGSNESLTAVAAAPDNQTEKALTKVEYLNNGLAVLHLSSGKQGPVSLCETRISEIESSLKLLQQKLPKGLLIVGPRADMFCVGADLSAIAEVKSSSEGSLLASKGQAVFNLLEELPCPTVAVISGPCVGGGFELALACDYRICSDDSSTLIGLPEVKLGIIPGFGGCQRLPRLIGVVKALDLILAGKTLRPKEALAQGLVSEIVATHHLRSRAESIALGKSAPIKTKLTIRDLFLTHSAVGRYLVKSGAEKRIKRKTKGKYPAPPAALETILLGLEQGIQVGLKKEAEWIGRLLMTTESKALVRLFFLTERAKGLGKGAGKDLSDLHAIVIGAGVMGAGIAESLARKKIPVALKDVHEEALRNAQATIEKSIQTSTYLSASEQRSISEAISYINEDSFTKGNTNFVIEAIVERIDVKRSIFSEIAAKLPSNSIIASNTSSLSIDEMAQAVPQPERFIGMHFFNPVRKMPLVEIIRGQATSEKTIVITAALAKKLGKVPVVVENVPGFLVNRILFPYLNAAAFLLGQGYSVTTIDEAALEFGMPMGPLRLLDEVGHDVADHVSAIMETGYGERMRAFPFSKRLVQHGRLGKKSGAGFYSYTAERPTVKSDLTELLDLPPNPNGGFNKSDLQDILIISLVQEAVRCHDEGVAGAPGNDAAGQIDLATVLGIGFPPFIGGVLQYADSLGALEVQSRAQKLHQVDPTLFPIAKGVSQRAQSGRLFVEAV